MIDWMLKAVVCFGFILALLGAGIDYLLPEASPGLNLPQILIIAAGLSLSLIAWQRRRPSLRRRLVRALGKTLLAAGAVSLITLVALEIVLTVVGMSTLYLASPPPIRVTPIDWWVCDAPGCHYIYDNVQEACQKGGVPERICAVNRHGYAGSRDFVPPEADDDALRILLLGDSFAFGRTAELGKSYAEYLEAEFPEALIWNTGMSGTGTNQVVRAFEYFAPQLRDRAAAQGTDLLVLIIPRQEYVDSPSELFLAAVQLMQDTGLPYMNPAHVLDAESDYAPAGDGHWSTEGHQKVGAYLSECVIAFFESGELANCEPVVMPR